MNYRSMAKSASRRRETLQTKITSTKEELAAMEKELQVLDGILKALPSGAMKVGPGRPRGRKRRGGKWRKGSPGRPPKWYVEKQKAAGTGKAKRKAAKPKKAPMPKAPPKAKPAKKVKKPVSAKVLAGLAKARAVLAAKRQAAATPAAANP